MIKNDPELEKKIPAKPSRLYNVWQQYDEFVRSLHLKSLQTKSTRRKIFKKILKKILVIFTGAFFTTFAFYFFLKPNKIYNPGLNGLWQIICSLLIKNEKSFFRYYFGLGLASNLLIIFVMWYRFRAKLQVVGTAIFYVMAQYIWTRLFGQLLGDELIKGSGYLFNLKWEESTGMSTNNILFALSFPFYVVVGAIAAIIHTYGYSIIFRAKATPGGLEIIAAHFASQPKSKFPLSSALKYSGWSILFLTTLIEFFNKSEFPWGLISYLKFLLSNRELWATGSYIFVSGLFMNKLFPREQIILLKIHSVSEQDRSRALRILEDFFPSYYNISQKEGQTEREVYVTECYLSRWNYFLLEPELKPTGKNLIHEAS